MREKLAIFLRGQDKVAVWSSSWVIFTILFILIFWVISLPFLPTQIPLFYSLSWGEAQLISVYQFIVVPAIIILVSLINLIIAWHLHASQIVLKRILFISSSLTATLILVAVIRIIFIFV